jgi:acyl carrier protein
MRWSREASRELREKLRNEISRLKERSIQPHEIADDMLLFDANQDGSENLGLDSLDALELAMWIEEHHQIAVPRDVDFKDLGTIDDIVRYVEALVNHGSDGPI